MMGGSDYLCESRFIGKEDRNGPFPSSCEKGPDWRGVLDKTKNLENSINWWMLVQQPDCVDRITLRGLGTEKTINSPKRDCPMRLQTLCDDMLIVIYATDSPRWWSTTNDEGCFLTKVNIDCDLDLNQ